MAVYTVLERADIEALIQPFGIGPLVDFEGVAAGIENTNYFIRTDQSEFPSEFRTQPIQAYALTLYESASKVELKFFIALTTALNQRNLPVPCPLKDVDGTAMQLFQQKPVLITPWASGSHPNKPTLAQCQQIAVTLARIHQACLSLNIQHDSSHNLSWVEQCAQRLKAVLNDDDLALLNELPRFKQRCQSHPDLPKAIIHGDLFRDKVLFEGDDLTAIIDFNNAGTGQLMFDLAVLVNDWCSTADGQLDPALYHAVITAYQQQRPLTGDEQLLWPDFLRLAAARFWISRLYSQHFPDMNRDRPGSLVELKDPDEYRKILLARIQHPPS